MAADRHASRQRDPPRRLDNLTRRRLRLRARCLKILMRPRFQLAALRLENLSLLAAPTQPDAHPSLQAKGMFWGKSRLQLLHIE